MKKVFLSIFIALQTAAVAAQDFNEVSIRYSPMTLDMTWQGDMAEFGSRNDVYQGFAVGYKHGFELWEETNLYAMVGATLQWNSKKFDYIEIEGKSILVDDRENFVNLMLPVSLMYHLCITEHVGIEPFAGVQGTWHAIAEDSYSDYYKDDYGKPNKFAFGWHVGLDITYDRFALGGGYQADFTKFDDNAIYTSKCSRWNIKLAYRF